jgi:hypothetical protein
MPVPLWPFLSPSCAALGKLNGIPATRGWITTTLACVYEVRDGKLAYECLYWDRANTCAKWGLRCDCVGAQATGTEGRAPSHRRKASSRLTRDEADGRWSVASMCKPTRPLVKGN